MSAKCWVSLKSNIALTGENMVWDQFSCVQGFRQAFAASVLAVRLTEVPDPALSLNLGFDWIREISLFEILIVLSVTDFQVAAYCCQPVVLCLGLWVPPDNFSLNRSLFLQFFPAASPTAASLACLMFGELFSHFQVHSPYAITKKGKDDPGHCNKHWD